jgi:hypothetical protein
VGSFPSYVAAMMILRDGRLARLKRKLAVRTRNQVQVRDGPERLAEERWDGEGGNCGSAAARVHDRVR